MSEDFYPDLRRAKQPVLFIAIDMWGIEGEYADGNWHSLVHDFAVDWARKNPQQENATLWSSVQPCTISLMAPPATWRPVLNCRGSSYKTSKAICKPIAAHTRKSPGKSW